MIVCLTNFAASEQSAIDYKLTIFKICQMSRLLVVNGKKNREIQQIKLISCFVTACVRSTTGGYVFSTCLLTRGYSSHWSQVPSWRAGAGKGGSLHSGQGYPTDRAGGSPEIAPTVCAAVQQAVSTSCSDE